MADKSKQEIDLNEAECGDLDAYIDAWEAGRLDSAAKQDDFDAMADQYGKTKKSIKNLREVLSVCDSMGVDLLSVGVKTRFIKNTITWPFRTKGSFFTRHHNHNGWPAAWNIPKTVEGLKMGGGNSNQAQFEGEVIEGVYLKKNGVWYRVVDY